MKESNRRWLVVSYDHSALGAPSIGQCRSSGSASDGEDKITGTGLIENLAADRLMPGADSPELKSIRKSSAPISIRELARRTQINPIAKAPGCPVEWVLWD
jgi:hypothetical protein